ncbi:MAG: hypothetical protein H6559_13670 [Lewinellaceae bacterium]|nr:hypothetical protein [Lewinellaceae bacterium]
MRHSVVFSREGGDGIVVRVFLAKSEGNRDFPNPDGWCRYLPGSWLSGILYWFLFRILNAEGFRWEVPPQPEMPAQGCWPNKSLLAKLNQFIYSSMASTYASPLLLYIEGHSYCKIAEVLETSPLKVLLRIQKGKSILLGKLETGKAEACFN